MRPAGDWLAHSRFDHTARIKTNAGSAEQRSITALAAFAVLGAVVWASPLEIGTFGLLLAGVTLLAIVAVPRDTPSRLQLVGAYLVGGGIAGALILLSAIVRFRNVCGTPGGQVETASGTSYECYAVETLWFLLPYAVLTCLGVLMLFLAWNRGRSR